MRKMAVAFAMAMGLMAVWAVAASAAPVRAGVDSQQRHYSTIVPVDYYHNHHHYHHRHWEHGHWRYY
jgi:adenosylcobinamide amidohydrolase